MDSSGTAALDGGEQAIRVGVRQGSAVAPALDHFLGQPRFRPAELRRLRYYGVEDRPCKPDSFL